MVQPLWSFPRHWSNVTHNCPQPFRKHFCQAYQTFQNCFISILENIHITLSMYILCFIFVSAIKYFLLSIIKNLLALVTLEKVIRKRGIPCKQSWRTAVWCFARKPRMICDIRKERAKNCIFFSFMRTRNEGKTGSTIIDGKFAKLLCHTEPTLRFVMTVYKY